MFRRATITLVLALSSTPLSALAEDTRVLVSSDDPASSMFPSNRFTVLDFSQNTLRRVNLPQPDCASQVLACEDVDVLNSLDGFSVQPRLSIPFSGPIDVASVNSQHVFLVSLGSPVGRGSFGEKVGINPIVWDVETNTLHAQADQLLAPHNRYALVVTNGVRDAAGDPIERPRWGFFGDLVEDAIAASRHPRHRIVGLSIFTTMSTTTMLEKIRRQLDSV